MNPQTDIISPPRRPLDVEDYIDMLRRRKHWVLGPTFFAITISVVVAFLWPDTYISSGSIRVASSPVPQKLIPATINIEMSQRVSEIAQQILSRSELLEVVNRFKLYSEEDLLPDDKVEKTLKNLKIGMVQNVQVDIGRSVVPAFTISFSYHDPRVAQQVVDFIIGKFTEGTTRTVRDQLKVAQNFIADQVEQAKRDLDQLDRQLAEFRARNAGRLPDQLGANAQQLNSAQAQLSTIYSQMNRINQERLLVEAELRTLNDQLKALGETPNEVVQTAKSERLLQYEREIVRLEGMIATMLQQYKENHPDVQGVRAQLEGLRKKKAEILAEEANLPPAETAASARRLSASDQEKARTLQAAISRAQARLEAQKLELNELSREEKRVSGVIASLQARIQGVPVSEQQYDALIRDHALAKAKYQELMLKKQQSDLAFTLEDQKTAERLEKLDPANFPQKPALPNRPLIVGMGLGIGLMVGLALAGAREVRDSSLKNLKDVRAYTQLPILGSVPFLENDVVVRKRRRMLIFAWSLALFFGLSAMGASVIYYLYFARKA